MTEKIEKYTCISKIKKEVEFYFFENIIEYEYK